jgi:2',3'-cyclic-nucleotide 2'-phosphodiesterase (5'-nucleotidase family)
MLQRRLRTLFLCALLLGAAVPAAAQRPGFQAEFAVVQLNDVYRIDAVDNGERGGIGRIVTLAAKTRRETRRPVFVLHAGDFIAPSLESRYFAGLQMIDALNFLHARVPVLAVPGNHEFDEEKSAMLAGAIRASRFPWLASNVRLATDDADVDRRLGGDTVFTAGGMRVGIFTLTFLDATRGYASADTDVLASARRQILKLERAGAEVIIGLTHLDLADDRRIARLRRDHPRFLWIAGGHEHFLIRDEPSDSTALITKGDSNARRVWKVLVGRENGQPAVHAEPVEVNASLAVDAGYRREVENRYRAEIRKAIPMFDVQIGTSAVTLDGTEETVRDAESNWGNYLADLMRAAFPDVPADVAVLNGGAIRIDDNFSGPIRWEHLQRTFGFPTRVGLVWLRGKDLRERLLERSVSGGRGEGRFLQVSGIRFRFDRRKAPGQRVSGVQLRQGEGWVDLDETRVYVVAVPDYLYRGGDDYHFKDRALMTVPPGPDLKLLAFDALTASYGRGEPIAPRVEGRIIEER